MKNRAFLIASAISLTLCSWNELEAGEPKVGAKPPPLGLEKVLQAPLDTQASWDALKGKVIVLEFWATWCGPCVAAIPHLNELADEFKDKPVQFIAITDEEEKVVAPFLKRKPIHAWVGLDTDKSMFKDYGISGIPHTVVIDRKGKIAAITYPSSLTKQHLNELVAGKKIELATPARGEGLRPGELPGSANDTRDALFQVLIRPSGGPGSRSASRQGSITTMGSTVLDILSTCHRINSVRIVTNSVLPEGKFDFVVKTSAKDQDTARRWLRQAVEATFGLSAFRETREIDVYVLTANPEATKLMASTGGFSASSGPGRIQAVNASVSWLAGSLESRLKKPVIDETKLTERYDFELKWEGEDKEHPDFETMAKAVRDQLGLELTPARRRVEVLVVDAATIETDSQNAPDRRP